MIRKLVMKIVGGVVIVMVLALVVVWLLIDSIAKGGIEYGGTYALDVKTQVGEVDVKLLAGKVTLDDLTIDNPDGYTDARLVEARHGEIDVQTRSLFTSTVVIPRIEFNDVTIHVEEKGQTNNISEVINNVLEKMKTEEEPSGRKLKIDVIRFTNITAIIRMRHRKEPLKVVVDKIEFKDIMGGDAKGVVTSELIRRLFPALIASVIQQGGPGLGALGRTLKNDVAGFSGELGQGAVSLIEQVPGIGAEIAAKALDAMNKAGKDIGEDARKTIDDTLKGLGDLIPGND